jgi:hypothetical protein
VTNGSTAFITYGYLEGSLLYIVSNIGVGEVLSIYVFDGNQKLQLDIKKQAETLIQVLSSKFGLEFTRVRSIH